MVVVDKLTALYFFDISVIESYAVLYSVIPNHIVSYAPK